ncbi:MULTISPECIES: hypothetical protein [unclassified Pseudoalteromonas]|nr:MULTISPECIES: hypothetical protein [unclassified Pseudoalteromonas]KPV95198.1 hypothetical protein AN214_02711 [Pseudoalteromonas sp. P1-9]MCF6455762.1 hypothetical protein [Pseudoalteromonas sp. MMG024]
MNTSNAFDLLFTAGLTTFVVASLITAGMTLALVTGSLIGATYLVFK